MANSWLRLWHDMPNDPKWRTIARVSNQPITAVLSVYIHLLVIASNATERGRTQPNANEDIASALDLKCEQINEILSAMEGRVIENGRLTGWEKRQVYREDGSAERARAWRKAKVEEKRTQANATERKQTPDTDTDTDTDTEVKAIAIGRPNCPHQEIINLYHEILITSPRIKDWTPARAASLKARWNEGTDRQTLDYWRRLFEYISGIPFLTGKTASNGRKPFVLSLDWLLKAENFAKVREGRYEDISV